METLISKIEVDPEFSLLPILPRGNKVLIEYIAPAEELGNTGLQRLETTEERSSKGVVKAVGPGFPDSPVLSRPGMTVEYYRHQAIKDYMVEGRPYDIISDNEVILVL